MAGSSLLFVARALQNASPISTSIFAFLSGPLTCGLLHTYNIRGDTALLVVGVGLATVSAGLYSVNQDIVHSISLSTLFLVLHAFSAVLATISYRLSPLHPLAAFPGPTVNKITSLKLAYMVYTGKRHLIIKSLHEKYGVFVRTGPNTLSIDSHTAVQPIYSSAKCLDKSEAYRPGRFDHGGLFFIRSREQHKIRRRIWADAFSDSSLDNAMDVLARRAHQLVSCVADRRTENGIVDLSSCLRHWSYDVMGEFTFGGSSRIELMQDGDAHGLVKSAKDAMIAFEILGEVPTLFDIMCYLPLTRDVHVLNRVAFSLMAARKNSKENNLDLYFHLLRGKEHGKGLSDDELGNDSIVAIEAGSDATSGTLIFLLYYLIENRGVYERVTEELDLHFPNGFSSSGDLKSLQELPYLNAVINESLRLGTPFPGLPRVVGPDGIVLDGKAIPGGTIVGVPPYAQQLNPENFWPRPLEFLPERWLPDGLGPDSIVRRSAVMCFSSGPFGCLGKTFAIRELQAVAAELLLSYTINFAPSFDSAKFMGGVLNMRTTLFEHPLLIQYTSRAKDSRI